MGDEQLQRDHDGDAEQHRYDGRSVDFEFAKHQRWNFNDGWHGLIISAEQRLGAVFKQQAHGDRSDQRRHIIAFFTHRLVRGPFHDNTHRHAHKHRRNHGEPCGQTAGDNERNGKHQRVGADHDEVAVREIDQSDDAVHHGVAEGHKRIHAADFQTVEDLTDEHNDRIAHHPSFLVVSSVEVLFFLIPRVFSLFRRLDGVFVCRFAVAHFQHNHRFLRRTMLVERECAGSRPEKLIPAMALRISHEWRFHRLVRWPA